MSTYIFPLKASKKLFTLFDPSEPLRNTLWTTDHTIELPLHVKKEGPGSEKPITFIEMIETSVEAYGKKPALRVKRSGQKQWKTWTYDEYYRDIKHFANALISIGIASTKAVNINGFNDPAWFIGFFGSIFAHVIPIGVYLTSGPETCKYIAQHSEAELVLVESHVQLKKYLEKWNELPQLKNIIVYNEVALPEDIPPERLSNVLLWEEFLEIGAKFGVETEDFLLYERKIEQNPGNCCSIIYTSGTTGPSKGVMISHDNYIWLAKAYLAACPDIFPADIEEIRIVSYMPLNHIAAQFRELVISFLRGTCVYFALPTALQGSLIDTLKEVRPHSFTSVPRIWEKIEASVKLMEKEAMEKNLTEWAKSIGVEGTLAELESQPTPIEWSRAKTLVYSKIKKALGLEECRVFSSGAAPLSESTRTYLASLNIFVVNLYGMSEIAGPQTYYCPRKGMMPSLTSAHVSIPGTELMIMNPDAEGIGEICFKGRHRFLGYYKDEANTKATIDEDGYLHSGDLGYVDNKGHLYITGRLKELIITSGGENVSPILIELQIKSAIPELSQVIVVGDGRKYLGMLITLKHEQASDGTWKENLAANVERELVSRNVTAKNVEDLRFDANFVNYIQGRLDMVNAQATNRVHQIRKWYLLEGDFTVAGGEFTHTFKLRRGIISKKYAHEIEELYEEPRL